jgi:hypothetical protein
VLKYCNIIATKHGNNTRKMIVITHTNHCNNWIKAVNLKFKGKPFQCEMHQFSSVINIVQFELVQTNCNTTICDSKYVFVWWMSNQKQELAYNAGGHLSLLCNSRHVRIMQSVILNV